MFETIRKYFLNQKIDRLLKQKIKHRKLLLSNTNHGEGYNPTDLEIQELRQELISKLSKDREINA